MLGFQERWRLPEVTEKVEDTVFTCNLFKVSAYLLVIVLRRFS